MTEHKIDVEHIKTRYAWTRESALVINFIPRESKDEQPRTNYTIQPAP